MVQLNIRQLGIVWLVLTFIVHEEDRHVSLGEVTLHQQCPVHISMTPRL